ncbi:MAG: hypothetical protein RRX93_07815 [Bacteroidales bacterium]
MKKILCIFLLFACMGCKSGQKLTTDTTLLQSHHAEHKTTNKDSLLFYKHDSVFVWIKGDTVYQSRFRSEYCTRFRDRTDTLCIIDTLQLKKTVFKNVKTPPNQWQIFQIWCGRIGLVFLLLFLGYRVWKYRYKINHSP